MNDQPMDDTPLDAGRVKSLFTTDDGGYRFSRWGRPIAPIIFGTDDVTLGHLKDAIAATIKDAGHEMVEVDPELGSNLLIFFCQEWEELDMVPNLDQMLPDLDILKNSLNRTGANQYRTFSFDENGAIKFCILLLKYDDFMAETPIQTLACGQVTQCLLLWGDHAFKDESPIAIVPTNGMCVIKPPFTAVIRGAYDATMPPSATDDAHALRLAARGELILEEMVDEASA